ncbi:hypothetical protein PR202_ga31343 [Eleusine coracana subsp. coracana]|uniref:adenylate dimethylallyltransferase (ADP/ATP-dependent) n=1 Tax=Eleusine coracana subsp. coracana TaxID=191504 RepID=A0AAV5DRG0_ELECO|nr:hypothetical protein QOZ80_1AG0017790 [Eleusine coracana subsp. coracana]GJN13010.1 hypothetical protein PR202_ga31343 [Eleusine coracana subsp. coracana]
MEKGTAAATNKAKAKVVVVMGATATGKSKLAIDLALRFGGEVINSDKIQVHDGLDVVTNKVTASERRGVPHHLIGGVHPNADYTVDDFRLDARRAVELVLARGRVPVVAGGSNRYLEALLDGDASFRRRYECCFLWVDADLLVLRRYIGRRVDAMLEQGLVDEVRGFFRPDGDYSRGISRAIGVPEMDAYFRLLEAHNNNNHKGDDDKNNNNNKLRLRVLLAVAVAKIKANTCALACRQLRKIHRLQTLPGCGWTLHRLDVTAVLAIKVGDVIGNDDAERAAWEADVAGPATRAVAAFLDDNNNDTRAHDRCDDDKDGFVVMQQAVTTTAAAADCCGLQLEKAVVARGRRGFVAMEPPAAVV